MADTFPAPQPAPVPQPIPDDLRQLLNDLLPYIHDLQAGFLEPKTQAVGYDQKSVNELYNRLKEVLK